MRAAGAERRAAQDRANSAGPDKGSCRRPAARRGSAGCPRDAQGRRRLPTGPGEVRVATPQGASSVGLVLVVDDPVVTEADDVANDTPASAQKLSFPMVVSGRIGKLEDVDWYSFEAQKGQRITFRSLGKSPGKQDPRLADAPRPDFEPARPKGPRAGRGRQHTLRRPVVVVPGAGDGDVFSAGP